MNFISGTDAGHRNISTHTYQSKVTHLTSPPTTVGDEWGNDDDFDLSSFSGNALDLPRSDIGSDDHLAGGGENDVGRVSHVQRGDEGEDWDAEFADDEDQGDTIKVASIADSTLAQLASLRKSNDRPGSDPHHPISLDGIAGTITRLATYKLAPHRVDMEGGGDWDEDLEVPDTFPGLISLRGDSASGFASDMDFETPSVGSTSDATTSGSVPSDVHQRSLTESSYLGSRRNQHSSASSISSSFALSPVKDKQTDNSKKQNSVAKASVDNVVDKKEEEDDFELPDEVFKLTLSPTIGRQRSNPTLEQQRALWGEDGKLSSSPGHVSSSEANARKSEAEEENMLDGMDFPEEMFAKNKEEVPHAASQLQARLNARRAASERLHSSIGGSKWIGGSRESEFTQGLIITDDLDLSPSRLKAKKLSNRIREAAHQRRRSRDHKTVTSQKVAAEFEMNDREIPSTSQSLAALTQNPSSPFSQTQLQKSENDAVPLQQARYKAAGSSRLLASTAASRARENPPRSASPRPSPILESNRWGRRAATPVQDDVSNSRKSSLAQPRGSYGQCGSNSDLSSSAILTPLNASATRYTMPTAASRARQADAFRPPTSSPSSSPVVTRVMKGPKRARTYGDGRELDSIDDLPISQERISTTARVVKNVPSTKKDAAHIPTFRQPVNVNNSLSVTQQPSRGKNKQTKRKQPMLIRNLGGSNVAPRVEGDMRWNPRLQRWEGNEEEGRSFENAVKGSGRPALIAHLSIGSTNVVLGPASKGITTRNIQSDPISPPPVGARVVGDMIFDPIRLRWTDKNEEEEVDVFAAMDDDSDEEREEVGGNSLMVGKNQKETSGSIRTHHSSASLRLQSKTQAAAMQGPEWTEAAISQVLQTSRKQMPEILSSRISSALWSECLEAQTRHDEEVANFIPKRESNLMVGRRRTAASTTPVITPARDRNSHLYMIQILARKAMPD